MNYINYSNLCYYKPLVIAFIGVDFKRNQSGITRIINIDPRPQLTLYLRSCGQVLSRVNLWLTTILRHGLNGKRSKFCVTG